MDLKPNDFGKYRKEDVIRAGYKIFEKVKREINVNISESERRKDIEAKKQNVEFGYVTATEIKKELGINLTHEQRLKYCIGFECRKEWRGCVPVFDLAEIMLKDAMGEL